MTPSVSGSILVVEDDSAVRDLVASCLAIEGYTVEEAQDGAEAIQALDQQRRPVDPLLLVLLDMMLPEVDGLEVLRHWAGAGAPVPVVAMSANHTLLSAAMAAGAQATLAKPFDIEQLVAVVERHRLPHSN
jgi:two-component system response regulator MprA